MGQTWAGLIEIALRSGETVRWCDGGFVRWGAALFESASAQFGVVDAIEVPEEGVGDVVPDVTLTINPPSLSAAAQFAQPGNQSSPARIWLAEIDPATASPIGQPLPMFNGLLDVCTITMEVGVLAMEVVLVPHAERLFTIDEGNTLSPARHQAIWPGETGEDHATGVGLAVPWGTQAPTGYGGGFVNGGGGPSDMFTKQFGYDF